MALFVFNTQQPPPFLLPAGVSAWLKLPLIIQSNHLSTILIQATSTFSNLKTPKKNLRPLREMSRFSVINTMSLTSTIAEKPIAVKNSIPITLISYRYQEFEVRGLNNLDYTKCLLGRNAPRGVHLSQREVNWLFESDVRATYSPEDPRCKFLLQQKSSPLAMDFWEKYTEPRKFLSRKSQEAKTSFRALPRDKHNQHKGTVVLSDGIAKLLVPDIDLLSLQNVSYLDVVWKVHRASSGDHMPEATMGRIWEGIVINVFHFEAESLKVTKLAEVKSEDVRKYWRRVSDSELALRRRRVRPVAADFFDDYPSRANGQGDHTPSTISEQ